MRPLRGGQGTFDKILKNIRLVADKVPHLDRRQLRRVVGRQLSGAARLPARAGLRRQAAEGRVQADHPRAEAAAAEGLHSADRSSATAGKPLNGTCMTSAGAGVTTTSACDSCHFLDEKMSFLREETMKRGFKTVDGVHMGPCEIHKQHAHTDRSRRLALRVPGLRRQHAASRPGTSTAATTTCARAAAQRFEKITAGTTATTARSSPSAPAAARRRRTSSSAT